MKKIFIIVFMFFLLCGCTDKNEIEYKQINCNEKNELLLNGAILIDVRTKEEYENSHLENSINIPIDEILDGVMKLGINDDNIIIVYCQSGKRSASAYNELINNGYKNVYDLGAMSNCEE